MRLEIGRRKGGTDTPCALCGRRFFSTLDYVRRKLKQKEEQS